MQNQSLLLVNPNQFQNEEVQRVLAANGQAADCTETCFGAEVRLATHHEDYALLICSNILLDGPGGPVIERAWNGWRIPTLVLKHHFPLPQIRRAPESFDSPSEAHLGAIEVPCSDDRFVEVVEHALRKASTLTAEGRLHADAVTGRRLGWEGRSSSTKFAMTLFRVEEMIERRQLSWEHGLDEIWPFVRDIFIGVEPPPEVVAAMDRLSFVAGEVELQAAVHREALRALGMLHDELP